MILIIIIIISIIIAWTIDTFERHVEELITIMKLLAILFYALGFAEFQHQGTVAEVPHHGKVDH